MNTFEDIGFLTKINSLFKSKFDIQVKIGFEQEFYTQMPLDALEKQYPEFEFETETGPNQYEAITQPSFALEELCITLESLRNNPQIDCSAKPYEKLPGSALNLSVSLWRNNENILQNHNHKDESQVLIWSVSGLEDLANELMYIYCPTIESYKRIQEAGDHVPTKICWGFNNRTSAFRIPTTSPDLIRIENRIIGADSKPIAACNATLLSIYHGIQNQLTVNHKIYGNSAHEQYQYIKLINNYEEAVSRHEEWIKTNTPLPYFRGVMDGAYHK
jgi:glutamine synthetase